MRRLSEVLVQIGVPAVEGEPAEGRFLRDACEDAEGAGRGGNAVIGKVDARFYRVAPAHTREIVDVLIRELLAALAPSVVSDRNVARYGDVGQAPDREGTVQTGKQLPRIEIRVHPLPHAAVIKPAETELVHGACGKGPLVREIQIYVIETPIAPEVVVC